MSYFEKSIPNSAIAITLCGYIALRFCGNLCRVTPKLSIPAHEVAIFTTYSSDCPKYALKQLLRGYHKSCVATKGHHILLYPKLVLGLNG